MRAWCPLPAAAYARSWSDRHDRRRPVGRVDRVTRPPYGIKVAAGDRPAGDLPHERTGAAEHHSAGPAGARLRVLRAFNGGITPTLGPDADRHVRCDFTMTIEAAATLVTAPSGDGLVTYAPPAGTVTASPPGSTSNRIVSSARAKAAPLFRTKTTRVKRAGPVHFKLALSAKAKATHKKKHRLSLTVKLVFSRRRARRRAGRSRSRFNSPSSPRRTPRSSPTAIAAFQSTSTSSGLPFSTM